MTLKELKSFYNGKRVLVTGHTGFKGSWLVRILTLAGAQVTGYALNPPTEPALFEIAGLEDTIKSITGDIRDLSHLRRVFDEVKPEIVFHLAVFPLTLGAGIKLKVLRSLALGTAVITGNVGAEGIDEDYQVIIPAETDEEYEKQIVEYLNDPEKRSLRAMESRNYIKEHFSWKTSERILAQVYGDGKQ